jgi:hypothetical protein
VQATRLGRRQRHLGYLLEIGWRNRQSLNHHPKADAGGGAATLVTKDEPTGRHCRASQVVPSIAVRMESFFGTAGLSHSLADAVAEIAFTACMNAMSQLAEA